MKKSLIALAFGTLALGMSEFVMMGILPDIARSLGVSIPEAGHLISAYALGVCSARAYGARRPETSAETDTAGAYGDDRGG